MKNRLRPRYGVNGGGTTIGIFDIYRPRPPDVRRVRVFVVRAISCPGRHLERRLPVSGLERDPACHPERSEGSRRPSSQILRCAQDDRHDLQMSTALAHLLTNWW